MVARKFGADNISILNNPSDGAQRRVINALGVFSSAPAGEIERIVAEPAVNAALRNRPLAINVFGMDAVFCNYLLYEVLVDADKRSGCTATHIWRS
jgi:hypothetical protein